MIATSKDRQRSERGSNGGEYAESANFGLRENLVMFGAIMEIAVKREVTTIPEEKIEEHVIRSRLETLNFYENGG